MYLQKLEIQGFKSFAQKTVFEFRENLTAIVGPNGSGKSNVADAIRWVLGEQSLKLLRGKKSEDVIYHGAVNRSRVGMAEVNLYLNNESRLLDLDYSEVIISRRLYRDGESDYLINGNRVTLSEVTMLLAKANFGQKSYSVVGQGMVENVLNATPQQRKGFFDEAAGVKHFQIRRDQSLNKLLRTEENLQQTETLIAEIEPRLRSLTRQVKKLEKREQLETELRALQIEYYGSLWHQLQTDRKQQQTSFSAATTKQEKLAADLAKISAQIDTLGEEKSRSEVYDQLQTKIRDLQKEKNALVKQQTVLQGRLELEQEKQGKLNLVWLEQKKSDIAAQRLRLQENIRNEHNATVQLQNTLSGKIGQQKEIMKKFQELEYKLLKLKEGVHSGTRLTLQDIRERLTALYHEHEKFFRQLMDTNDLETFQHRKLEAKDLTMGLASLLDDLGDKQEDKQTLNKIGEMQNKVTLFSQQRDSLVQSVQDLRVKIESGKTRLLMMEETYTQLSAETAKIDNDLKSVSAALHAKDESAKLTEYRKQDNALQQEVDHIEKAIQKLQGEVRGFNEHEQKKKEALLQLQHTARETQNALNTLTAQAQEMKIALTRSETKLEDLKEEMARELANNVIQKVHAYGRIGEGLHSLEARITKLKQQLELIGGIDPETMQEYEATKKRFEFLTTGRDDLKKALADLEKIIDELDVNIKKQFDTSFHVISANFSEYFKVLFGGGSAKLRLLTEEVANEEEAQAAEGENTVPVQVDMTKEHTQIVKKLIERKKKVISGVEIEAVPPGKKMKNVQALSGGEKALTSLSLLSAILATNPAPFVMLDEVEAALDEANSEKFAVIIKKLSQKTQFIVVTHNRVTMHYADVLYGVTMGEDGSSHILSLKIEEARKMEKEGKLKTIAS